MLELNIFHKGTVYFPLIEGELTLSSTMYGACSTLGFKVIKDENISMLEGDMVTLIIDGVKMFKGFIFSKKRDKNDIIYVTCYDQIRFLLNKDTKIYENLTATQFINTICNEYKLKIGSIDNTKYVIERRVDADRKLLDMIYSAINITQNMTGEKYVFYDDFMAITLKNVKDMKTDYLLDNKEAINFSYESSIDENTYTQIKVVDDITYKLREVVVVSDEEKIKKFGILQKLYYLKNDLNPKEFARKRLEEQKSETRKLDVYGATGRLNLRAGNSIIVDLNLGDILYNDLCTITHLRHKFTYDHHTMDMTLDINRQF